MSGAYYRCHDCNERFSFDDLGQVTRDNPKGGWKKIVYACMSCATANGDYTEPKKEIPREDCVMHGIRQGLPLCGFTSNIPIEWPDGHRWTGFPDIDNMTCEKCIEEAKHIRDKNL